MPDDHPSQSRIPRPVDLPGIPGLVGVEPVEQGPDLGYDRRARIGRAQQMFAGVVVEPEGLFEEIPDRAIGGLLLDLSLV